MDNHRPINRQLLYAVSVALQRGLDVPRNVIDSINYFNSPAFYEKRDKAKSSLLDFTLFTKPDYQVNWHHRYLSSQLDKFISGEIPRLMVFMPPRYGKSELVSRRLPAYIFGLNPDSCIIACSYSDDLARRMNKDVQRIIKSPSYNLLFPDTNLSGEKGVATLSSDFFEILFRQGSYRSAGVRGGITGMGFNYGIIDDPFKNREQAESQLYRERVFEWYTSDFFTRAESGASILLTMTRWHEDDLAGRILDDTWNVISLPAIKEKPVEGEALSEYDPRHIGEALWPDKYNLDYLLKAKDTLGSYQFEGLYQQRPKQREGNVIKRSWWKIRTESVGNYVSVVRYWDKAATEDGGCASAGVIIALCTDGSYEVHDSITGHWSYNDRETIIRQTAAVDNNNYAAVLTAHEQEPGSGGKESAESTSKNLSGYWVQTDKVTGSKDVRLYPFIAQVESGNVFLIVGKWNKNYISESTDLRLGSRDNRDQMDASAGAFNLITKTGSGIYV